MMRTHWCSSVCTQKGSEEARRPPERAETNEGFQTLKVAEMHTEQEAHKSPREQEQKRQGVAEMHPRVGGAAAEDADTRRGLKRSAELPLDEGARDRAPSRGEHLEQAADAADAHMSVGKMEMISWAAAKVTKSPAACELIGAEIWTLARTAIDLFGASVSKFAKKFTSYSIDSSLIIDLSAKRDDGPREIGAIAARIPNRTLDWKRAMHFLSHDITPQRERNEGAD